MTAGVTSAGTAAVLRRLAGTPAQPPSGGRRSSSADLALRPSYGSADGEAPGRYPYTRGIDERMYVDGPWVMGMYSGYATPAETNARFRQLLEAGQTGLSVALDLPTQMGIDSDDRRAAGEVGKVGVPLTNVEDLLALLDGIPLDRVRQMRTSANAIGPIFAAFMIVALEELGADANSFRLMLQNDPLKEYSARGTFIFPPAAGLCLAVDVIEHFARHHPDWEPIEFCGYHIRDAGGTAVQEVAIATVNGLAYLDAAVARGVDVRGLAHALFLFLAAGVDIFEEAAKLRAARRLWSRLLHEGYGVPQEEAAINVFAYTLGGALVAPQPLNNAVRVAYEALAAVLGGVQTLATSSYDEALGLPSATAARLALRTQQILAYESGAGAVADPLGGSHYVEDLTDRLEAEIARYAMRLQELGGAVAVIDSGFVAAELADSAYRLQQEIELGERPVVGLNVHADAAAAPEIADVLQPPSEHEREQVSRLEAVRRRRDQRRVASALQDVTVAAGRGENAVPSLVEAARTRATLGEMVTALKAVHGAHKPSGIVLR